MPASAAGANMIELLLEPIIELIALVVRGVGLVIVWIRCGAIAGILARDISPEAFMWQAAARLTGVLLIATLAAVAVWPGVGSPAVWLVCVGLGAVVFACGYIAEYRNVRRTG
jgi:drug/metabolite transporter (DMT)-like permease